MVPTVVTEESAPDEPAPDEQPEQAEPAMDMSVTLPDEGGRPVVPDPEEEPEPAEPDLPAVEAAAPGPEQVPVAPAPASGRGWWVKLAAGGAVLLAALALILVSFTGGGEDEGDQVPAPAAVAPASPAPPPAQAPAPVKHAIRVKTGPVAATCSLTMPDSVVLESSTPCAFQAPAGAEVTLLVRAAGHVDYEKSWVVKGVEEMDLVLQEEEAPASTAPEPGVEAAALEGKPAKKEQRKKRKRRGVEKKKNTLGEGIVNY